jgi:hypothetical protein
MYPNTGATIRHDLNTVVMEASQADKFYIGPKLLPFYGVDAKSGIYPKLTKAISELLKPGSTDRERSGSYGRIKRAWTNDTYDTQDRGIEEEIDDVDVKDISRWFDLEAITAKTVLRAMMLAQEIRAAAAIFNTTNFGAATNSTVAYTEANIATIDAVQDIQIAIQKIVNNAEIPNTIVMTPNVFNRLRRSTLMKSFITGVNLPAANITANTIQQAFAANGIEQVLIGAAPYDSSVKKGTQVYTAANIWADTYIWVGRVASGDPYNGGAGRTLGWNAEGGQFVTETYREEKIRSNIVRVRQHTIEKIIDSSCGTLIATQYS